jgi:hypothetical protein
MFLAYKYNPNKAHKFDFINILYKANHSKMNPMDKYIDKIEYSKFFLQNKECVAGTLH